MTPAEFRAGRKRLGMSQTQIGRALELKGPDQARTVRAWEKGTRPISGPVAVAMRLMLERVEEEAAPPLAELLESPDAE